MSTDTPAAAPGKVVHIVQFKYKPGTSDDEKVLVADRFQELAKTCLSRVTGKPYIVSLAAGLNVTRETEHDKGYEHAFVVTFQNEADLDYYIHDDPVHGAFKAFAGPFLYADVSVFDFVDGVFQKKKKE
ncbi:hypothetical protein M407DRAFT_243748 [Tulasnella calospora MUT 4182]|uniref:Stress-response A/B barrel domain-containing protein n=1 Tax=Tulasnella calospora MUT 4182 TaxID=1051891 RepID=A0A0C3QI36_9AGAM|nr:hypothetical protein M407DRAFT_243748 [Tulasnella calospora MUT 4182]